MMYSILITVININSRVTVVKPKESSLIPNSQHEAFKELGHIIKDCDLRVILHQEEMKFQNIACYEKLRLQLA